MNRVGIIHQITDFIKNKHLYRKASFDKMSALYLSRILRTLALNLSSVFIYMYLFKIGYSLITITYFLMGYYLFRVIITIPIGVFVPKIGSRKMLLAGNLAQIPMMILFASISRIGIIAIIIGLIFKAIGEVVSSLANNIIFSETKNSKNSGKEIGIMIIFERIAIIVAPLFGGFMMSRISPEFTILASSVLLAIASMPLFTIKGLEKKNYYINFEGFPWKAYRGTMIGQISRGFNHIASIFWPLFVTAFLVIEDQYGLIGVVTSINACFGLLIAFFIGKKMDKISRDGQRRFYTISIIFHACSLFLSGMVHNLPTMVLSSMIFGASATLYVITYFKAHYHAADISGSRVIYEIAMHFWWSVFALAGVIVLNLMLRFSSNQEFGARSFFVISAISFLILIFANYPLYRKRKF